mgnify:CR=1 FL=1
MPDATTCPDCGAPLKASGLAGQCPMCLLKLGMGTPAIAELDPLAPAHDEAASLAGTRFGDYELISFIARGGMGAVFRAQQLSLNREVAIKMVLSGRFASPEEQRRFRSRRSLRRSWTTRTSLPSTTWESTRTRLFSRWR